MSKKMQREAAVDRFVQLRPLVVAKMNESIPPELAAEFESITVHQLKALGCLASDGLTMHELAHCLGITGATACALADRLVARGLALRTPDPADRRVVRLCLSERGADLAARHRQSKRRAVERLFELLSDEQVAAWIEIMETLTAGPVLAGDLVGAER